MFTNNTSFKSSLSQQIGHLLAFIILFEKKIQQFRIKLAGNQEFHSRLAFQILDKKRKCIISPQDITDTINRFAYSKSIQQVQAFCRKYTANGSFSYDEFIKFLTPKTNKILAQRLMIRTYRQGTVLPQYLISLLLQTLSTAITMTTITENLRRQLQSNTQITHLQILQLFRQSCSSRQKLFYFINASTNGQGDYDFSQQEMDYLGFHVRGKCQLEDISDQQIKQILCPLDMNYQKPYTKTNGFSNTLDGKTRTDYFRTKSEFNNQNLKTKQNQQPFRKTVNFLNTNYQKTSKNFYQTNQDKNKGFGSLQSKQMNFQQLDQNVQTKSPTPMNAQKNFPLLSPHLIMDHYQMLSKNQGPSYQQQNEQNDSSQISSINYGNLYIQRFTRGASSSNNENPLGLGYSKKLNFGNNESKSGRQLDILLNMDKYQNKNKKQKFHDDFKGKNTKFLDDSDNISAESAFMQY